MPSQDAFPMIDKIIVNSSRNCPLTLIRGLIVLLVDINFAGPFLMIFDRPNVPETMEVMNANQKEGVEVSILLFIVVKSTFVITIIVKCNCGMDSTKGSAKDRRIARK